LLGFRFWTCKRDAISTIFNASCLARFKKPFWFFFVVVFAGRIFFGEKNVSILKVKYDVFILMYCKCYNLKYEQIVFNIIIDHY